MHMSRFSLKKHSQHSVQNWSSPGVKNIRSVMDTCRLISSLNNINIGQGLRHDMQNTPLALQGAIIIYTTVGTSNDITRYCTPEGKDLAPCRPY